MTPSPAIVAFPAVITFLVCVAPPDRGTLAPEPKETHERCSPITGGASEHHEGTAGWISDHTVLYAADRNTQAEFMSKLERLPKPSY